MSKRQDRQGVRTPADLERKYNFTQTYGDLAKAVRQAQQAASDAQRAMATKLDASQLSAAINTALAEAKKSGEFTPKKGVDYFTVEEVRSIVDEVVRIVLEQSSSARIGTVNILASEWVGTASPYSQVVEIEGVTENSQVDLTPSVEQLSIFHEKDLAFVTENYGGVVTVYAIGQKPENDYTIQVTITEVL